MLRDDGRSDFGALMTKRGGAQAVLIAFDLLRLVGVDERRRPIEAAGGAHAARRRRQYLLLALAGACSDASRGDLRPLAVRRLNPDDVGPSEAIWLRAGANKRPEKSPIAD